jgi:hypothetical protein
MLCEAAKESSLHQIDATSNATDHAMSTLAISESGERGKTKSRHTVKNDG